MRITSKGQVTIPKHIRDKLGVMPGDEVGFREDGQAVILENVSAQSASEKVMQAIQRAQELVKQMQRDGRMEPLGTSVDEFMDDLRGYSGDADDPGFQRRP